MAKKELVDYVTRHLKKGISKDKIRKHMLKVGHGASSVDEAIKTALKSLGKEDKDQIKKKSIGRNIKVWAIVITILIVMVLVVWDLFVIFGPPEEVSDICEIVNQCKDYTDPYDCIANPCNISDYCLLSDIGDVCFNCDEYHSDEINVCMALLEEDLSYCKNEFTTEERKDECSRKFNLLYALKNKDVSLCESLKERQDRIICKAAVQKESKQCDGLEGDLNLQCRAYAAGRCEDIPADIEEGMESCKDLFAILDALIEKDRSVCDDAVNSKSRIFCRAIATMDKNYCNEQSNTVKECFEQKKAALAS